MQATSKTVINPFDIKGLYNGVGSVIISTLPACKFIRIFIFMYPYLSYMFMNNFSRIILFSI